MVGEGTGEVLWKIRKTISEDKSGLSTPGTAYLSYAPIFKC